MTVDAPDPAHGPAEREDRQPDQNHDQEGEDDVTRYCFHDAAEASELVNDQELGTGRSRNNQDL